MQRLTQSRWKTAVLLAAFSIAGCFNTKNEPDIETKNETNASVPLELMRVLPVENIREPSGLTIHNGQLFTVSDKDDETIYRLDLGEQVATAEAAVQLEHSQEAERLDLEGITTNQGDFLLLAEAAHLVLRVTQTGEVKSTERIDDFQTDGLFVTQGAGPEGIAVLDGTAIIAAERQPCGLLVLELGRKPRMIDDETDFPQLPPRPKDATGLWVDGTELWCLTRNGESIVRFDASRGDLPILGSYSFHQHAASLEFSENTYGTAEGLAADDEHIYVIFDNNHLTAKDDPTDTRGRIAIFKRPE